MRIAYWLRHQTSQKQINIMNQVISGHKPKITTVIDPLVSGSFDTLVMMGIGGNSRHVYDSWLAAGKNIIFLDKGYTRGEHLRVSINSFQPLAYFQAENKPSDRFEELKLQIKPYNQNHLRKFILLDGASNKYCLWHGLPHYYDWGVEMVKKIKEHSSLPIIYRPRPSHNEERAIPGTMLSINKELEHDFERASIVVSHGGNIGFDAVLAGVPHFAIDETIARPVSNTDWNTLDTPMTIEDEVRHQWLCDVAYCQWKPIEFVSGVAWEYVFNVLEQIKAGVTFYEQL